MIINAEDAAKILANANSVSIYAHINTDCDAMGSSLALREALLSMGKKVDVFIHSKFPENFKFYGDISFINKKSCDSYDLAVVLDLPNESRLGKYKFYYRRGVKTTLCIDHHFEANEKFCNFNYVKQISSTSELLFDVFNKLKIKFTPSICRNLISGILTDTGRFMHNTTEDTLLVISKLLKLGNLNLSDIISELFNQMSMPVFNMLKLAYKKIEFFANNKLAIIMFSHNEFIENGVTLDDLDAIPDLPLQLESVQFAILSSEDDKGYFRTSLRSKGDVSARAVAEYFGGGGHYNSSGCKIFGEYAEVKQKLVDAVLAVNGWKKWAVQDL